MIRKIHLIFALLLGLAVGVAQATPISGIIGSSSTFSVIHDGAIPSGSGDPDFWRWFDPDQDITLDYTGNTLSLVSPQTFALSVPATEAIEEIIFIDMQLTLNGDGTVGGYLLYSLGLPEASVFVFPPQVLGGPFNTWDLTGNSLSVWVWGPDHEPQLHDLGMDLALVLTVPEPGTLALVLFGLAGMTMAARRRRTAVARR